MNEMNEVTSSSSSPEESKPINPLQRIIGVFSSPQRTFTDIASHPTWVLPLVILVVASIVVSQILLPAIINDFQSSERYQKMIENDQIPSDQLEQALETQINIMKKTTAIGAGISTIISCIVVTAILLFVGNIILGGNAKFRQLLSLYCWAGLVSLLGFILRIPIGLQQQSLKIYFGPAVLFPPEAEKSVLFGIAAALDIFVLWRIVLLAVGFSIIYRFSMGKSFAAVVGLYTLFVAGSIAVGNLF